MLFFLCSAYMLLRHRNYFGWKLSWLSIGIFLVGGIVNGYLMFDNPFVQDQIINFSTSILVGLSLILGKRALNQ